MGLPVDRLTVNTGPITGAAFLVADLGYPGQLRQRQRYWCIASVFSLVVVGCLSCSLWQNFPWTAGRGTDLAALMLTFSA